MPAVARRQESMLGRKERAQKQVDAIHDLLKKFPIQSDPSILPPLRPQVWESDEKHILRHSAECEEKDRP